MGAIPAALREAAALEIEPPAARRIVTTGIGSSGAHARYLAHLLAESGLTARFVATGALGADRRDLLVVFSQGLSPNARVALAHPERWARVLLVTGAASDESSTTGDDAARVAARRDAEAAGVHVTPLPGGLERGTLLRIIGPMAGYLVAWRIAAALARRAAARPLPPLDVENVLDAVASADARGADLAASQRPLASDEPVQLITCRSPAEIAENLRLKLLEGLLRPIPPICELLDFAHGPYQSIADGSATLLALTRRDTPPAHALLERLTKMLDPARHRLLRLDARLPGALAILEHEAQLNQLVLSAIADGRIDQIEWPGKGREAPLYDVAIVAEPSAEDRVEAAQPSHRLDESTWPEIEARLAGGARIAVVPLGATEQHGPHLPFGTDTWIADALAERFCARVPGAIALPALPIGCSSEHSAFPGTLDLDDSTLRAVLRDVVASLSRHGFETIVVFSAHGGNCAMLGAGEAELAAAARPAELLVLGDLEEAVGVWHRAAAAHGIAPAAAGHHAGEFETSIVAGLRPASVRRDRLAPGLTDLPGDPQQVFHPSLRDHAPSGVVGDPRKADAARSDRYLDAWADALVDWYEKKNRRKTNGIQNA